MNKSQIIKAICWELTNYNLNFGYISTEKTAEKILYLCAEFYGYKDNCPECKKEIEK